MAMTSNQGGGVFSDINITPLTDIFLVLLIIFMVTTAVTIESADTTTGAPASVTITAAAADGSFSATVPVGFGSNAHRSAKLHT